MDADAVQFFLGDPQGWKKPTPHPHADALRATDLAVFIHAPYLVNVATTNNRIRIPGRKMLAPARRGGRGDRRDGPDRARRARRRRGRPGRRRRELAQDVRARAGGRLPAADPHREHRRRRERDGPHASTRSAGCGTRSASSAPASCSTPATRGPPAGTWSASSTGRAITGRIDLVHVNSSRDASAPGADRHANTRRHDRPGADRRGVPRGGRAVIVETPVDGGATDVAYLREAMGR